MKKVELHCHFDGSLNLKHASELLGSEAKPLMVGRGSTNLAEYLEKFATPLQLLQTLDNLREFSRLLAEDLVKDDVIYAEVRFCPRLHTKDNTTLKPVIQAVISGLRMVPAVKTNVILCMTRDLPYQDNYAIIEAAHKLLGAGVCGIDLAGDEAAMPNSEFEDLFRAVKAKGIPLTIHAGEADTHHGVDDALNFGAMRIGHGVHAINSLKVVDRLVRERIPLEVCPTSNLDTGIYHDLSEHPIRRLLDQGVIVTINTDNRTVSDTTLEREYQLLRTTHGFTDEDFLRCNLNAALAAFISPEEKVSLCKQLLDDYALNVRPTSCAVK